MAAPMQAAPPGPHQAQWFNPWEPPPVFVPPVGDPQILERINVTVRYAIKSGPAFLEMMKEKHRSDPNFAFLFTGDAYHFWRWSLFCALHNIPVDKPPTGAPTGLPQQQPMPLQPYSAAHAVHAAPAPMAQLPPEVETGFTQVLESLTGSKDSIKSSQQWFMACAGYAPSLVRLMGRRLVSLPDYDKQLHIIYLANDILFKALQQRPQGTPTPPYDPVAAAFQPVIGPMLAAAYIRGGRTEEVRTKLSKILSFWTERGVFDTAAAARLEQAMLTITDPVAAVEQAPAPAPPPHYAAPMPSPAQYHPGGAPPPGGHFQAYPPMGQPPAAPGGYPPGMPWQQGPPPQQQQQQQQQPHGWPQHAAPPGQPPAPQQPWQQQQPQWQQQGPPGMPPPQGPGAAPWGGGPPPPPHGAFMHPTGGHMPPPGWPGAPPPPAMPPPMAHPADPARAQSGGFQGALSAALSAPPPDLAASATADTKAQAEADGPVPTSSFSFPPGLIPRLCRDKERHSNPYDPLDPKDIEREGLPPPPEKDAYLRSRLDRFYAEIKDYRPGTTRTDMDDGRDKDRERGPGRERDRDTDRDDDRSRRHYYEPRDRQRGGMAADGSFAGHGASQYAGLGSHSHGQDETFNSDSYSDYRQLRSSSYHDMIAKGDTWSNMSRGGR